MSSPSTQDDLLLSAAAAAAKGASMRDKMNNKTVLIVGAGPTGLLLALWLTRLGVHVIIIDKKNEPGEASRAIAVHARTLEFYRQLGVVEAGATHLGIDGHSKGTSGDEKASGSGKAASSSAVIAQGAKIERIAVREAGQVKGTLPFGDFGKGESAFPFVLSIAQDAHERVLVAELEKLGVKVRRGVELVGFKQDEHGVEARLRHVSNRDKENKDGGVGDDEGEKETVHMAYIAGCDGANSTVREVAKIPMPGGTYAQRFFVADVNVSGPVADSMIATGSMSPCFTGSDFCIVVSLPGTNSMRLIGIIPDTLLSTKSKDDLVFADVADSVHRNTGLVIDKDKDVNWFATYRVHHKCASAFRSSRAFILGDAAHLHSPVGGQGMNTGLGDASNLAWKLAAVLHSRLHPSALDTYESERIAFARLLVRTTDFFFTWVTDQGWSGWLLRRWVVPYVLAVLFRIPFAAKMAFRRNSQILIGYGKSRLSWGEEAIAALGGGTGGGSGWGWRKSTVKAGERLPWLEKVMEDGVEKDNYAVLGLDWQVHVYGELGAGSSGLRKKCEEWEIQLHVFSWTDAIAAKGFVRGAKYLVRPDSHIGVVDEGESTDVLEAYIRAWEISGIR